MICSVLQRMFVLALLAHIAAAQRTSLPPGIVLPDMEIQRRSAEMQVSLRILKQDDSSWNSPSAFTVSKLDLKAPGRAQREYRKGCQLLARKDFKNAVTKLEAAIAIYPMYVSAHNALGSAYFYLGQNDLARMEFAKAIQLDDHVSDLYWNLGRVELVQEDYRHAEASIQKASSIAPLDTNLLVALAYAQLLNHDYTAVIETVQHIHSGKHEGAASAHYLAASAWQAQGNLQEMQSELQTFLAENPNSETADQVRKAIEQLKAINQQSATSVPATTPGNKAEASLRSSLMDQKVLQEFREKQQIAEAEAAKSDCNSCITPGSTAQDKSSNSSISVARDTNPDYTGWVLRKSVDEVSVLFTATNHGQPVTNLRREEVMIRDDGQLPERISEFRGEADLPLRLGLLIDTSGSITKRFLFEQESAINFMNELVKGNNDLAFVAGFSSSVMLVQDFTRDPNQISHGINQLVPLGGTAVWDAVSFAADKLAERKEEHPVAKILVVISDGIDNSSSATLKQAIERAQRDEVIIYAVSAPEPVSNGSTLVGNHAMKLLAALTGGNAFFPGSSGNFRHTFAELQQVIRGRYLVSYRPASFLHDGRYRPIDITAQQSGHKLRIYARKGYYTDTNPTE